MSDETTDPTADLAAEVIDIPATTLAGVISAAAEIIGGETRMMVGGGGAQFEVNWPLSEALAEQLAKGEIRVVEPEAAKPVKKAAGKK